MNPATLLLLLLAVGLQAQVWVGAGSLRRVAAASGDTPGPSVRYRADLSRSTIRFKATVNHFLVKEVKGTFKKFDFSGTLSAQDPAASRGRLIIKMGSVTSDTFGVSDSLLQEQLQAQQHPEATVDMIAVRTTPEADVYEVDTLAVFQGREHRSTLRIKIARFEGHLRMLGKYLTPADAAGRRAEIELSLHLTPDA